MRFFFLAKEKKTFLSTKTSSSRFLFCSLSVSLSLSLSLFVQVIFEGRRERLLFCRCSFAVVVSLFAAASSRVSALSLFFRCLRVYLLKESEEEKKGRKRKKKTKKTDLFFLSLNQISTKTHSNTKKTSERSTAAATPFTENAQKDFRRADIFFFSSCVRYLVAERRERRERFKNGFLGKKDGRGTSTSSTRPCKRRGRR